MKLNAEWTNDCQGKKDYDGPIVEVSTRYWPQGGGFSTFSRAEGWKDNDARPEIKPSAKSSIIIRAREYKDEITLIEAEFEGETEADVKASVERWAQKQMDRIVYALKVAFKSLPSVEDLG